MIFHNGISLDIFGLYKQVSYVLYANLRKSGSVFGGTHLLKKEVIS